jgi:hypothetical protein
VIRGSCLCGGIAWEIEGLLELMGHCHCSMCRKAHGSAFETGASTSAEKFRWVRGEELIRLYESHPGSHRGFCSRCGSVVPGVSVSNEERVFISVGCLDDDPGTRPVAHIFVASKAPWQEITDELPRFDAYPPGYGGEEIEREALPPPRAGVLRGSCLCGRGAAAVPKLPLLTLSKGTERSVREQPVCRAEGLPLDPRSGSARHLRATRGEAVHGRLLSRLRVEHAAYRPARVRGDSGGLVGR